MGVLLGSGCLTSYPVVLLIPENKSRRSIFRCNAGSRTWSFNKSTAKSWVSALFRASSVFGGFGRSRPEEGSAARRGEGALKDGFNAICPYVRFMKRGLTRVHGLTHHVDTGNTNTNGTCGRKREERQLCKKAENNQTHAAGFNIIVFEVL